MNKRDFLEDLEFENPVEIRKIEEKPPGRGNFVYLIIILILLGVSGYLGYRQFSFNKREKLLKEEIATLKQKLDKREEELSLLTEKLNQIQSVFSKTNKNKSELLKNISSLEKRVKEQKNSINSLSRKIKTLNKEVKRLQNSNKKLKTNIQTLKKQLSEKEKEIALKEGKIKELENKIAQQSETLKNLRETFSMESSASKKLISELISEQKKNEKLLKENLNLKNKISQLNKKIHSLETVEEGDIVPSSDYLTLAKPLINPPARVKSRGIFSRVKGYAVVNAFIDEYGKVLNAYFVYSNIPQEKIDKGTLANRVLTTVKKWKFSPPLYRGKIPVKTWQPVIVPVESE